MAVLLLRMHWVFAVDTQGGTWLALLESDMNERTPTGARKVKIA